MMTLRFGKFAVIAATFRGTSGGLGVRGSAAMTCRPVWCSAPVFIRSCHCSLLEALGNICVGTEAGMKGRLSSEPKTLNQAWKL